MSEDDLDARVAAFRDPRDARAARRQDLVTALYERGNTQAAIAARLGVSISTVSADLRAAAAVAGTSATADAWIRGRAGRGEPTGEQISADEWVRGRSNALNRRREVEARFGAKLRAEAGLPAEEDE